MTTTPPPEDTTESRSEYTVQQTAAYFADRAERVREEYVAGIRSVRHAVSLDSIAAFLRRVATDDLDIFVRPVAPVPAAEDDAVEKAARAARAHARGAPSNGSEDDHWRGVARAALDAAGVPALQAGFRPALAGENDRDAWRYAQERDEARVALAALREQAETALCEIDHSGAGTYLARQRLRAALADTAGAPRTDAS